MKSIKSLLCLIFLFSFFCFPNSAQAALITLTSNGEIIWNVLAFESDLTPVIPGRSSLEIKSLAESPNPSPSADISLINQDGKVQLIVSGDQGTHQADITSYDQDIIEIEEKSEAQTIKIASLDNTFLIRQKGIIAKTIFPIRINSQARELSVQTPSGYRYLAILPFQAMQNLVQANIINRLSSEEILLTEDERGELEYQVSGERTISLFNIIKFTIPVNTSISASTGQILSIDQPIWLSLFGFLLT